MLKTRMATILSLLTRERVKKKAGTDDGNRGKKSLRKKSHQAEKQNLPALPSSAIHLILSHSSPLDVLKWRRVNHIFKDIVDDQLKKILYLDVWRMDTTSLLPKGRDNDGDFYRVSKHSRLLVHVDAYCAVIVADSMEAEERKTPRRVRERMLLAERNHRDKEAKDKRSHEEAKDKDRLIAALAVFGRFARTVTLDATVAEIILERRAGCLMQSASVDGLRSSYAPARVRDGSVQSLPEGIEEDREASEADRETEEEEAREEEESYALAQESPPHAFFPAVREVTVRVSQDDWRSLLSLPSHSLPSSLLFPLASLQLFRLHIVSSTPPPSHSRLRPFRDWIRADRLGHKYAQQFTKKPSGGSQASTVA